MENLVLTGFGHLQKMLCYLVLAIPTHHPSLEMCICLWPEFDCPEVTLCGWQTIKIQLLLITMTLVFQQKWF